MKYPVLSAISPDKSLQVASSPSFQIIFMVHPHIFLVEAPFFHHHEFSMNKVAYPLVMSSLLANPPIGVGLFKVRTQQFSKLFWVNFCHTSTLNPYINPYKIYASHVWPVENSNFSSISPSFPHFLIIFWGGFLILSQGLELAAFHQADARSSVATSSRHPRNTMELGVLSECSVNPSFKAGSSFGRDELVQ